MSSRLIFLLLLSVLAAPAGYSQAPQLYLSPSIVTSCTPDGLGRAVVSWRNATAPVTVYAQDSSGTTLFAESPFGNGSSETGDWLRDGLVFLLRDATGQVIGQARAVVRCAAQAVSLCPALGTSNYFPLQVGNRWVYRVDSRVATAAYLTRQVTRSELINGQTWYVVSDTTAAGTPAISRYRSDESGRIFQLLTAANGAQSEQLWLDPAQVGAGPATLTVQSRGGAFQTALGRFSEVVTATATFGSLTFESQTYARGIGLVARSADLLSGSSGGFYDGWNLVFAQLGETITPRLPARRISLSVEDDQPLVSAHQVTNCAIPCYFVACSVGGSDLPGTYKPCLQTRLSLEDPTLADPTAAPAQLQWQLTDSSGGVVYQSQQSAPTWLIGGEWTAYLQLPLYSKPNQPLPAGTYRLQATVQLSGGTERTATLPITIR